MTKKREDYWTWKKGDVIVSPCVSCKHKHPHKATCDAFPKEIPMTILLAEHDHKTPYPGDNGILYEKADPPKD